MLQHYGSRVGVMTTGCPADGRPGFKPPRQHSQYGDPKGSQFVSLAVLKLLPAEFEPCWLWRSPESLNGSILRQLLHRDSPAPSATADHIEERWIQKRWCDAVKGQLPSFTLVLGWLLLHIIATAYPNHYETIFFCCQIFQYNYVQLVRQ